MLRRVFYGLAALVLLLAVVLTAGLWWLGSESGLQFAVSRLQESVRAGGGEIEIDRADGSLHRGVRIERFEWRSNGVGASGTGLVARWSLPGLLQRRLVITELLADTVELQLAPSEPPPDPAEPRTMPGIFALPLDLAVERLAIGELRIVPGSAPGEPAPEAVVVNDLSARLAYQDGRFSIEGLGAVTAYGRLADARLEMGNAPPHRLQAELPMQGEYRQVPFDLRLTAAGDLNRLQAELAGRIADADLRLDAALAPLAAMPLNSAELKVAELDLKRLLPAAPQTRIDAQLTLAPQEQAGDWRGNLQLRNAASGRLPDGRLPLSSLESSISILKAHDPGSRQLQLHDLRLGLAGMDGGHISGTVDVFPGRPLAMAAISLPEIAASLTFSAIDVAQFAPQAPATALDGSLELQRHEFALRLSQSRERMRAILPAASAGAAGDAEVVVAGRLDEAALRLDEARIRLGETRVEAAGTASLSPPHSIAMKGSMKRVKPGQWLPPGAPVADRWRQGTVSGSWSIDGKVLPGLDALLSLAIADSTLGGEPLAADLRTRLVLAADWSPVRVAQAVVDVRYAGNRLRASGALGDAADKLTVGLSLPQPGLLDKRLQGRLSLDGELAGAFDRLQAKVSVKGDGLSFEQPDGALQVGSVDLRASGPATAVMEPQAALDVALRLKRVSAAGRQLDALEILAKGTPAKHRFSLSAAGEGQAAKLNGEGHAELQDEPSWRARLAGLELQGRVPMKLTAPAGLRIDGGGLQLDRFDLAVAGGQARLERLALKWSEPLSFSTRGAARDLPIMELLKIASPAPAGDGRGAGGTGARRTAPARADPLDALAGLRLDGSWDLSGTGVADLTGEARLSLREEGEGGIGLEGDNGVRVALKNGRVDGNFDLRLPSLAFTRPLTEPEFVLDGRLHLAGSVTGTVAAPQWDAKLTGEGLALLQRSVGWRLTDGVLSARFEGRRFELQALKLQAGEGSIELRGKAGLLDAPRAARGAAKAAKAGKAGVAKGATTLPFDGRFELTASRFPVPIGPGQRVALSGTTVLASGTDGLSLRGKLTVDQGIIEIQGSSAPALPGDVKLVYGDEARKETVSAKGSRDRASGNDAEGDPEAGSRIRILTELAVDLGDRLRVTGNGIAARLTGSLQVLGTLPDNPQLIGTVNIVDGSYQSYGQNLRIEKGRIRFNGPIDNPALDLVANRPFLPVEVGVSVTGTALNPKISLVSKPDMSETDKLAWLVLGTDPSNAPSAAQTLALREAAKSLLVESDGSYKPGIGERLGLDVMNFGYGSNTGPTQGVTESRNPTGLPGGPSASAANAQQEVVTLGKRIGSRLFVSYEQGVRGLYNLLRIQYALSQRLSLRAQSGSDNALDLLYSYSFD